MTIGIDVIIATTTTAMTDATTTVAMTATTGVTTTGVIIVMIAMMNVTTTDEMIDVMIDVARTTTIIKTALGRSGLHHHRPKGATPMVHSRKPTARSTLSS
jgi:cobalamin biosynthesis protein CobD/CbiB